jgi:hypothetical protein
MAWPADPQQQDRCHGVGAVAAAKAEEVNVDGRQNTPADATPQPWAARWLTRCFVLTSARAGAVHDLYSRDQVDQASFCFWVLSGALAYLARRVADGTISRDELLDRLMGLHRDVWHLRNMLESDPPSQTTAKAEWEYRIDGAPLPKWRPRGEGGAR